MFKISLAWSQAGLEFASATSWYTFNLPALQALALRIRVATRCLRCLSVRDPIGTVLTAAVADFDLYSVYWWIQFPGALNHRFVHHWRSMIVAAAALVSRELSFDDGAVSIAVAEQTIENACSFLHFCPVSNNRTLFHICLNPSPCQTAPWNFKAYCQPAKIGKSIKNNAAVSQRLTFIDVSWHVNHPFLADLWVQSRKLWTSLFACIDGMHTTYPFPTRVWQLIGGRIHGCESGNSGQNFPLLQTIMGRHVCILTACLRRTKDQGRIGEVCEKYMLRTCSVNKMS